MRVRKSPVAFVTFTSAAKELKNKIADKLPELLMYDQEGLGTGDIEGFLREMFRKRIPIVYISAMGICVRHIAAFAKDKLMDSPVIVIDERGQFVIPVLSGHVGGGNKLAREIAAAIGGTAVITTATDVNNIFSIDTFAVSNGYRIVNREEIKRVSSRLLDKASARVRISGLGDIVIDSSDNEESVKEKIEGLLIPRTALSIGADIELARRKYVLGVGTRRGRTFDEIKDFVERTVPIDICDIGHVASVDLKSDEQGLIEYANYLRVPFVVYSAEELLKVPGEFEESSFVKEKLGVGNVCERAACLASNGGEKILAKTKGDGITVAIYEDRI